MKATGKILAIYVNDEILGLIDGYAKQEQKSGRSVIIRQTVLDFFWRGASDGHCFF